MYNYGYTVICRSLYPIKSWILKSCTIFTIDKMLKYVLNNTMAFKRYDKHIAKGKIMEAKWPCGGCRDALCVPSRGSQGCCKAVHHLPLTTYSLKPLVSLGLQINRSLHLFQALCNRFQFCYSRIQYNHKLCVNFFQHIFNTSEHIVAST